MLDAHLPQVAVDPVQRRRPDGDQPVLAPLALAHEQRGGALVHVIHLQRRELHAADTGAEQRLQHRAVADTDG